jgi:hypothetical protein
VLTAVVEVAVAVVVVAAVVVVGPSVVEVSIPGVPPIKTGRRATPPRTMAAVRAAAAQAGRRREDELAVSSSQVGPCGSSLIQGRMPSRASSRIRSSSSIEMPPELIAGQMQIAAKRAGLDSDHRRGFGGFKTLPIDQIDRSPLLDRQPGDRASEIW